MYWWKSLFGSFAFHHLLRHLFRKLLTIFILRFSHEFERDPLSRCMPRVACIRVLFNASSAVSMWNFHAVHCVYMRRYLELHRRSLLSRSRSRLITFRLTRVRYERALGIESAVIVTLKSVATNYRNRAAWNNTDSFILSCLPYKMTWNGLPKRKKQSGLLYI